VRQRKTDYGTIILHWLFVGAFAVALVSGLRIAAETPDRTWINMLDVVLPRASVWTLHMQAAVVLVAVALGYAVYLVRSGLVRRVQLDKVRLRGLFGRGQARLGALIALMYWIFFVTMVMLLVSGGLLYFGLYSNYDMAMLHWVGTWVILAFVVLHILTQYKSGGLSQLLRIFRPAPLPAPPPRLDTAELLALLAEQSARQSGSRDEFLPEAPSHPLQPRADARRERAPEANPARRPGPGPAKSRNPTLQANAFVVAAAAAITGASFIVATDQFAVDRLRIARINARDVPTLDGDTSDRAWRGVKPFSLLTGEGGNFDGKGETRITVRAVHDGTFAYFLFTWEDSTRSLKHLPLVKEADGWHLLHAGYRIGDEHRYNEDKFSVLLTTSDATLAGDRTFHAGPQPVANAPATMSGRGLHFTEGGYVDVWQWKATSGGATGWMDDAHIGPPLDPTPMQAANVVPYRGGFAPDPGTTNHKDNFAIEADTSGGPQRSRLIAPLRLPKVAATTTAAMGAVDLDPDHGDSDGARWFMTEQESVPYSTDADARIPVGTVIPGVIVNGEFSGDRADIRCAARWASGYWALEVKRRLDASSKFDVPIRTGVSMRLAAFDHSQIRHSRHVRPIRLEVEQ
jgi:hypothetical protein